MKSYHDLIVWQKLIDGSDFLLYKMLSPRAQSRGYLYKKKHKKEGFYCDRQDTHKTPCYI